MHSPAQPSALTPSSCAVLSNGHRIPLIGLGTYPTKGFLLTRTALRAYKLGYRNFDTSAAYNDNENWLGYALRYLRWTGRGRQLHVTTKLSNRAQRTGNVRGALEQSQRLLGNKPIDLYLMHWPNPDTYLDSWRQMESLYKEGAVRAIGVCNCHIHHLQKILEIATVTPLVNQLELHPLLSQVEIRDFCKAHGIAVQAYTPLARMHPKLIENPILVELATRYNKTVPQIVLRWDIQHGIITIPKSANPRRLQENISLFDFSLSEPDMHAIDSINENFRVRFDPDTCDYTKL
jgi:diketogulonate reductase-like aldo/keto reductase